MGEVRFDIDDDAIGVITISNPRKLNAWTEEMRVVLTEHFVRAIELPREECAGIVVTGDAGNFSSGQDLDQAVTWSDTYADTWVNAFRGFYDLPRKSPKPVIAAVEGVAAGSAFQFALCMDYRVTHPEARLGQPEIKSGQASVTGSALLAASVGITAMRALVLTAELVSGAEAYRIGFVDELTEQANVLPRAKQLARKMADLPHHAFAESKLAIASLEDDALDAAFAAAVRAHSNSFAAGDPKSAIGAFVDRRNHKASSGS